MSGQVATSAWRRARAWLQVLFGTAPARLADRPRQVLAAAGLAAEPLPPGQVHAQLQQGLHALALAPRPVTEAEPPQAAALEQAVVKALLARDWASRQLPRPAAAAAAADPDRE